MNERIVVHCKGLFIKKVNGRYREVSSLEFLTTSNVGVVENETLNPIIIEDSLPNSLPGDAIKIFEQRLPVNLFNVSECFKPMLQHNNIAFIYKGKKYIFMDNILNRIIEKEEE